MQDLVELGLAYNKQISSKKVIKHGRNRGFRRPESKHRWEYLNCGLVNTKEHKTNLIWAQKLKKLGFSVGYYYSDEVITFYFKVKDREVF
jgi:hypothetical protein